MLGRKTKKRLLSGPRNFPSGTAVVTKTGKFYINGNARLRITSDRVFDSWSFPIIVYGYDNVLKDYPIIGTLGFRDGTFIKNIMDAKMYIVAKSKKRPVASPDVLTDLNLSEKDAILVSEEECNLHKLGDPIS